MENKTISLKIECPACQGTGLYIGMAERNGAAIVCHQCKGSGCYHYQYSYKLFTKRKIRNDVKRVFGNSCGYIHSAEDVVADGKTIKFSKGGASYQEWLNGKEPEPLKELYCPLQWSGQRWHSPLHCKDNFWGGYISECPKRCDMAKCWELYEKENAEAINEQG